MTTLKHIPDHAERLGRYLPFVLRALPVLGAVVRGWGAALQVLEDDVFDVVHSNLFSRARGPTLDAWGEMFGVRRGGLSDQWYRQLIKGVARARRCDGSEDQLIRVWQAFMDPVPGTPAFYDLPPRGLMLVAWREVYAPRPYVKRAAEIMRGVCPTGSVTLVEALHLRALTPGSPPGLPLGPGIPARVH